MIKLTSLLVEVYKKEIDLNQKWWAILIDSIEDWEVIAPFLVSKGYKFEPGYTFSKNDLSTFNPFKDEKYFDSHEYDA